MSSEVTWDDFQQGVDRMLVVHKEMLQANVFDEEGRCVVSAEASIKMFSKAEIAVLLAIAMDRLAKIEIAQAYLGHV